jgi:hypothetical protein
MSVNNKTVISRRAAVAILGGSVIPGSGGCTSLRWWSDDEVQLVFVRLINARAIERNFEVVIERNNEVVFEDSYYEVPAGGTDREHPDEQNPNTHMIDPTWSEELAAFEIRARYLDIEDDDWQVASPAETDDTNVGVDLYFWERNIAPNFYTFETESELETAREFVETELERQSNRDRYGSEP